MRSIYKIILLSCVWGTLLISCKKDFNEIEDSDQRHIIFTFNTDSLFANLLCYDGDYYIIPKVINLPSNYRIRITAYCFDQDDILFHSEQIFTDLHADQQLKIRHLNKNHTYRIAFIADIVKYNSSIDFYETWYQLGTSSWSTIYLYADDRNDNAIYDVVGLATSLVQPSNQKEEVYFLPVTYNGFYQFTNFNTIDRLEGSIQSSISFVISTLEKKSNSSLPYQFDYRNPQENINIPVSLSYADSLVLLQLITTSLLSIDTTNITISNLQRRPFVATIDCQKRELHSCIFY